MVPKIKFRKAWNHFCKPPILWDQKSNFAKGDVNKEIPKMNEEDNNENQSIPEIENQNILNNENPGMSGEDNEEGNEEATENQINKNKMPTLKQTE